MKMGDAGKTVRLGILGLGNRGFEQTKLLSSMPDVRIQAVYDPCPDRVERMVRALSDRVSYPTAPAGGEDELLSREDIDAVVIMTDWESHIRLAIRAMEMGKHAGLEVGGACSVQECWDLVRTAQRTGMGCMLLENCCYNREEMALLNMVRDGLFGEIVHCQGGYEHDLRDEIGFGDKNRHYRQHHFAARNGELYPTHELGPIGLYLDLNGKNRMLSLVSMASKAVGLSQWLKEHRGDRPDLQAHRFTEGDVVTTMIRCARGETILLTHDCTLPRPYSRGGRIQGTKAIWMEDNRSIYVDGVTAHQAQDFSHSWESDAPYMDRYESGLWKQYREFGLRGGHGGMDYLVLRGFIEAIQQGTPMPIDVYYTAALMAITPLSEQSIACGSLPVAIPDFTEGKWLTGRPQAVGPYRLTQ
ncbi:MAG: Gfo/Idh/MocA family oxidoreductase [Clostridia bacterium]|nr:Gfo/Idh/MocA family oxidoreductase [Clostridia bacterium]